eukprot:gnl/MRDRNA2_/MRDRNA2_35824_c0_seq1.p1 gnl/MRDRNA2_/MRDRNA2_35824_c0~~gnl/MRDRNA2_/MRDRNA2_35824_c0_seq1.p1  ORF type:complete len:919 (+),score=169.15 gnl/MRDRNA2_/MRDRNA2_35824_c0_seq1:220-2757(+)
MIDAEGKLAQRFPTVLDTVTMVYRCTVLHADCVDSSGVSIFELTSEHLGWFGAFLWFCTEIFIFFGVLNAVASVFVVQAMKNDEAYVRHKISLINSHQDNDRLNQLEKLLHGLTQIHRQGHQRHTYSQGQNVESVVKYLQKEYPLASLELPDVTETVKKYSESIEVQKSRYQEVLDNYEVDERMMLLDIPSARIYSMGDEVELLVDKHSPLAQNANGIVDLGIAIAPKEAVEVPLLQKPLEATELLKEAARVQNHVKNIIWPHSDWANKNGKGRTDEFIWNETHRFCDEAFDPGTKSMRQIKQKVQTKYNGRYEFNHDYCRLGLIYYSADHLLKGLMKLLGYSAKGNEGIQVVHIENRFVTPTPDGWRDILVLLRVKVPSSSNVAIAWHHIMELQLHLKDLVEVRRCMHSFHNSIRGTLPKEAVSAILNGLVADDAPVLSISKEQWLECIKNDKVKSLLHDLGVKGHAQKDVIDIIDADGSGAVSSEELRKGLLMCVYRGLPQAHDLVDCRLKMREVQQWLHHHLEPQMHIVTDMLKSIQCTRRAPSPDNSCIVEPNSEPFSEPTSPNFMSPKEISVTEADSLQRSGSIRSQTSDSSLQEKNKTAGVKISKDAHAIIPIPRFVAGLTIHEEGHAGISLPSQFVLSAESMQNHIAEENVKVVQCSNKMNLSSLLLKGAEISGNHVAKKDATVVCFNGKAILPPPVSSDANCAKHDVAQLDTQIVHLNGKTAPQSSLVLGANVMDHVGKKDTNVSQLSEKALLHKELQKFKKALAETTNCLKDKDAEILQLKGKIEMLRDSVPGTLECLEKTVQFHQQIPQMYHNTLGNLPQSSTLLKDGLSLSMEL